MILPSGGGFPSRSIPAGPEVSTNFPIPAIPTIPAIPAMLGERIFLAGRVAREDAGARGGVSGVTGVTGLMRACGEEGDFCLI